MKKIEKDLLKMQMDKKLWEMPSKLSLSLIVFLFIISSHALSLSLYILNKLCSQIAFQPYKYFPNGFKYRHNYA